MTKDLLTQAAQKEAEGLYGYDSQVTMKDGTVIPSRSAAQGARYSAHVKCALLYSERAAGLVEAGKRLRKHASAAPNFSHEPGEEGYTGLDEALDQWDAALHAFNSQT